LEAEGITDCVRKHYHIQSDWDKQKFVNENVQTNLIKRDKQLIVLLATKMETFNNNVMLKFCRERKGRMHSF
jgi:HD superfamily phosphodiesterase